MGLYLLHVGVTVLIVWLCFVVSTPVSEINQWSTLSLKPTGPQGSELSSMVYYNGRLFVYGGINYTATADLWAFDTSYSVGYILLIDFYTISLLEI